MARHYRIQLVDAVTREAITEAGGVCYVAVKDSPEKIALQDSLGASASNPSALTNGIIEFYVADAIAAADLFIQAPSGHFLVVKDIAASGPNSFYVDKSRSDAMMVIPWSSVDATDATEEDTGFDLLVNTLVLPWGLGIDVTNAASTETIDLGILASESGGDANGFITAGDIGTAASVLIASTVTDGSTEEYLGSTTMGILLDVLFTAGADAATDVGTSYPKPYRCDGTAKSISYTYTAGTDTLVADGYFKIPVQLPILSL